MFKMFFNSKSMFSRVYCGAIARGSRAEKEFILDIVTIDNAISNCLGPTVFALLCSTT